MEAKMIPDERPHTVDYEESHWNGSSGREYFATPQAAHAFARRLQMAWCLREAIGRITVSVKRKNGRRENVSYSIS